MQNWLNRFRREGLAGLREKPRPGRANKLTGEQLARLPELIDELTAEKPGGRVKGKDIQARLAAQFGVHYALSSLYLLLHRQGWSWITVRSKHPKSDPIAEDIVDAICDAWNQFVSNVDAVKPLCHREWSII